MQLFALFPMTLALTSQIPMAGASSRPSTTTIFSSTFHQPLPPLIKPAFKANWNQHKWNENVSHIATGYIYSSPSAKKVRVDEAYDGTLGSSLFDYNKITAEGVYNIVWSLSPSLTSTPEFFTGYVDPAFPLLEEDLLVKSNAVYAGVATEPYSGTLTKWNLLYAGTIPTTVFLDENNVLHGYDYWAPNERTYATTRLFNVVIGEIPKDVFDFPQPGKRAKL